MNSLWPKVVVLIYICAIIFQACAYFVGWYSPPSDIGGEIYLPYLVVSGPIVWMLADMLAADLTRYIENIADVPVSPVTRVIIIPGILNILFGGVQWYVMTKWGIAWYQKRR